MITKIPISVNTLKHFGLLMASMGRSTFRGPRFTFIFTSSVVSPPNSSAVQSNVHLSSLHTTVSTQFDFEFNLKDYVSICIELTVPIDCRSKLTFGSMFLRALSVVQ